MYVFLNNYFSHIYWTDWVQPDARNPNAKIEMSDMTGNNRTTLINKGILWPNGLTLDLQAERLYWCDAYYNRIESISVGTPEQHRLVSYWYLILNNTQY